MTAYWAEDIVNKKEYKGGIGQMLKDRLPELYTNYKSLIADDEKYELSVMKGNDDIAVVPIEYKSTDIYKMSRILMKMQKLESNVLTIWREIEPEKRISVAKK